MPALAITDIYTYGIFALTQNILEHSCVGILMQVDSDKQGKIDD